MKPTIYYSPACLDHKGFPGFAEKPARLASLVSVFSDAGFNIVAPPPAEPEWLRRIHTPAYITTIEDISRKNLLAATFANVTSPHVQWYTRVSPGSYNAALHAAGAVCRAAEDTMSGKTMRTFCPVRPPGHHAGPDRGEGFCLFNNIAAGAFHALENGAGKVAIIDFDRHHANGTQDIIAASGTKNVLLVSSYQEGCKYNHNEMGGRISDTLLTLPLKAGSTWSEIGKRYADKVIPALYDFQPDLILISAGFDAHKDDPLTNLKMESMDYFRLTRMLVDAANDLCGGRIVSALEGGYEIDALAECVGYHLQALRR
ncbi:MAG TPA: histone deacetylase family protein [Alphaproteobacteria bacterium]